MPPNTDSACSPQMWLPPTPQSKLAVLPTSTLPVDHLVLLPPPALPVPNEQTGASFDRTDLQLEVPGYPPECKYGQPETLAPASAVPKRPRRSAAIAAARNLPRQPSPFDLEDDDDDDAVEDDPSPSASPPPASSSRGAGGGGSSKRKVSHSLIERRRREKINHCLATLRETVPSLREEGERKLARAKERGRKRGRGDEAGERGGLHKLEILQGTIAYIEDLRSQIARLERTALPAVPDLSPLSPSSDATAAAEKHPVNKVARRQRIDMPEPHLSDAFELATRCPQPSADSTGSNRSSSASGSADVDDHEASLLLLNFSTSPELRPIF
ncbi:hypothetical protein JCM8115_006103 [Rhodotorula mucilaginosa]